MLKKVSGSGGTRPIASVAALLLFGASLTGCWSATERSMMSAIEGFETPDGELGFVVDCVEGRRFAAEGDSTAPVVVVVSWEEDHEGVEGVIPLRLPARVVNMTEDLCGCLITPADLLEGRVPLGDGVEFDTAELEPLLDADPTVGARPVVRAFVDGEAAGSTVLHDDGLGPTTPMPVGIDRCVVTPV